jgi:hypothetical protein
MWQFQWMISLIPESILVSIYYAFLTIGITAYVGSKLFKRFPFKYIPVLGQFPFLSELVGVLLIALSCYLLGGYATEVVWRDRVQEVEAKVEVAKKESAEANTKLAAKRKEKQKVRVEYYTRVKERIVEKKVQIDAKCDLDPSVPQIHNEAAQNPNKGKVTVEDVKK